MTPREKHDELVRWFGHPEVRQFRAWGPIQVTWSVTAEWPGMSGHICAQGATVEEAIDRCWTQAIRARYIEYRGRHYKYVNDRWGPYMLTHEEYIDKLVDEIL